MLSNHVSCDYVVTSVTFYHSAIVDLTQSRAVHTVEHDPCCPDPTKLSAEECKAVHYGLCSPLLKLPSFSIPPAQTASSPSSPATPKGTCSSPLASSTPSSPVTPKGSAPSIAELLGATTPPIRNTPTISSPIFQRSVSPVVTSPAAGPTVSTTTQSKMSTPGAVVSNPNTTSTPKMDMEMLDPVTLLACDLEDQLQSLVNTFVAQDKVRLAARKKAETSPGAYKSSPLANISSPVSNKSISPIKKYDKKIKEDRSSGDESASSLSSETSQTSKSNGLTKLMTGSKVANVVTDPVLKELKKYSPETHSERNPFSFDLINKQLNAFSAHLEDNLHERSSSPSFKSSILPTLKPSPEYQQTGVKAQITKFASKEKDAFQNSPTNSLERRQVTKSKPAVQEPFSLTPTQPSSGPLTLDALQELLLKSTAELEKQPIQTTVFQSSRGPSVPFGETSTVDILQPVTNFGEEKFVPFYVNEACKDHNEFAPSTAPITSQSMLYPHHPQTFAKPGQDYVQSAVDYAKTRIQSVQQGNSREDTKPRLLKNGHLVSDAKTKWETIPQQTWNETHLVTDIDNALNESFQKGGHKRTLSMEGLLDVPSPSIPHPKLTTAQKQHIKERSLSPTDRHSHVPIRPFLTKGSVAERVLLFECCPDRALERTSSGNKSKQNLISTWRPGNSDVQNKTQFWEVVADSDKSVSLSHPFPSDSSSRESPLPTSPLRRVVKSGKRGDIPRFHFPDGRPHSQAGVDAHLKKVAAVFAGLNEGKASREEFGIITKACGLPLYWKLPLFLAARGDKKNSVSCDAFLEYWRRIVNTCHDEASKFVSILSRGKRNYLVSDDFFPMMQDVIESHAGLTFLKEAIEFHSRYIHTVIARIYYCVNRSWSGRISAPELRKSNFLQVLATLEEEEDINQVTDYFSYEHFYVIYCKFWELDKDHDLYIDQNDLKMHSGGALSTRIIQRIFSGAVTRGPKQKEGKMSYTEFVWFLISEEDKRHPRSIEYWFRCMDFDGDGFLSMYELEYFYQEQLQRLEALGIETLPFNDCLCQMLDILKPKVEGKISLADLKRCQMTPLFFDTFFNLEKYLDHEQRDPFASQREHDGDGPEMSDWDRFAADEYELLVAEEGATEQQDEIMYEEYEDEIPSNSEKGSSRRKNPSRPMETEDEDYDYADSDDYHY